MKAKALLTLVFVLFLGVVTVVAQNKVQVDSKQANELLKKDKNIIVLDVRTAEEFNEGHIKGAANIDIRKQDAYSKIDKLNRNSTYLVYCRTNHRSGMATDYMIQKGFKNVYQMMDGFPGWASNHLPWVK